MSGYQVDPQAVAVLREQSRATRRHTVELRMTAISSMHESSVNRVLAKNTAVGWLEESFQTLEEARRPRAPNADRIPDLRNRYRANMLQVIAYIFVINRRMKRANACMYVAPESIAAGLACAICLGDLTTGHALKTQCNHYYHAACLNQWATRGDSTCPMCRASVAFGEFPIDSLAIHASAAVKQKIKDMLRELYPPRGTGSS